MNRITPGISDEEFIRDKVPMTKQEVREVSLCKLNLKEDSVLYDVGSGTGSVAVEAALLSEQMKVYAVEVNPLALELLSANKKKFNCRNIEIVEGLAPEALMNLPVPTHAFIGGTKGNLNGILKALHEKNPAMRVVITAVSLESISEITAELKNYSLTDSEVVQISVSKAQNAGNYHLMIANNPVFIFSFTFAG